MTTQNNTPINLLKFAFAVILITIICLCLSGCSYSKKVHKTQTTSTEKLLKEKEDSINLLKQEIYQLQSELKQQQYAGVVFDSSRCPKILPVVITGCNNDSINSIVSMLNAKAEQYNQLIAGMSNKIEILSDGTIKAQGLLKSANYSNEIAKRQIATWQTKYDSLYTEKQKAEANKEIVTVEKSVEKKVTVFPWYFWLITGGFALLWLNKQFGGLSNIKFFGTNS